MYADCLLTADWDTQWNSPASARTNYYYSAGSGAHSIVLRTLGPPTSSAGAWPPISNVLGLVFACSSSNSGDVM